MISWFIAAIAALLLMGIQRFLYKVAAEKKYPTQWVTFSFMLTVTLLSTAGYVSGPQRESDIVFLMAMVFINSASFLVATVSHIEALKYIPSNIAYSITRLNIVVVAVFSILYFKEQVSFLQGLGLLTAIATMTLLAGQVKSESTESKQPHRGAMFIFLALVCGAAASISSKFAAMHTDKFAFMALSYFLGMIGSAGINRVLGDEKAAENRPAAIKLGILMGGFNFAGFFSFLYALEHGPLSLVAAIVGMHFVIAIILSSLIFHEKIKPAGLAGIMLTIISILLIRS